MSQPKNSENRKWKIIFVLGSPGGGKNTQCDLIEAKYQIFHYSSGDLLRQAVKEKDPDGELIEKCMKEGAIVPGKITCGLHKKTMQRNGKDYQYYLCDGFPRNEENLKIFLETFGDEIEIAGTFYIDCPIEVTKDRILKRSGNRIDDNLETLKKRYDIMEKETLPNLEHLKKYGEIWKINGAQTIEETFKCIDAILVNILEKRRTELKHN